MLPGSDALPTGWSVIKGEPGWKVVGDKIVVDPAGADTAPFVIPRANSPARVAPGLGYHAYRSVASTLANDPRTAELIVQNLVRRPTMDENNRPASAAGTLNHGGIPAGTGRFDDRVMSYILKDIKGNPVVVNVTRPGEHLLDPGYVAQYVLRDDGGTRILTAGAGNASLQKGFGALVGAEAFKLKNDALVRRSINDGARRR